MSLPSSSSAIAPDADPRVTLPSFSARPGREEAMLEASRAVVALFLKERTHEFPVKALAESAGLSERTFYRYFPRKEDAIRPYVEAGLDHIVAQIREAPPELPLRDALIQAHTAILDIARTHEGSAFLAVIHDSEPLRAVWTQVVTDAEALFAEVIAERLGIHPSSTRARFAGAMVATAARLALQDGVGGGSPSDRFADCLDLLGPRLLGPGLAAPSR